MSFTFEQIRDNTFGTRGNFNKNELEGTKSFVDHMVRSGHSYSLHPKIINNVSGFANEGFIAIHTEPPALGILFVKVQVGRGLFGKKYLYHMYIAKDSNMDDLKKHYEYPKYFDALPDIALLREGMKI